MAKSFFLLIFMLPLLLHGQSRTEKFFYNDYLETVDSASATIISVYIYDDNLPEAGIIKTYYPNGQLRSERHCSNLKKEEREGMSKSYHENGQVKAVSNYKDNLREGEFTTFYPSGQLKRKELYREGELVLGNCYTASGADTAHFDYEVMPKYPGGEKAFMKLLSEARYGPQAKDAKVTGTVHVAFTIDEEGKVRNMHIERSLHPQLDQEVLRVLDSMEDWQPAQQDAENVAIKYRIPVRFLLK